MVARLRQEGIDVYLADPANFADIYAMTRAVAERIGTPSAAEALIERLERQVAEHSADPIESKRVFVYDCCDPPFTAGGKTVLTEIIERAGGQNIFAGLDADWTHVSWEEVVSRRPELIVIHAYQYEGQGDVTDKKKALDRIPSLAKVPTATLPLGCSLGGLRSAEGVQRLRSALKRLPNQKSAEKPEKPEKQ